MDKENLILKQNGDVVEFIDGKLNKKCFDKVKVDEYLCSESILISHSKIYKENYYPHYLVVGKKFLKDLL